MQVEVQFIWKSVDKWSSPLPLSHSLTWGTPGLVSLLSWISTSTFFSILTSGFSSGGGGGPKRSSSSSSFFPGTNESQRTHQYSKEEKKRQIDSEVLIFPENKPTFVFVFLLLFSSFWFVLHLPLSHLGQSGLQHGLSFLLQSFSFTALLCCLRKATGLGLTKTWMFYLDDIIVHIQQSEKSWFVQSQSQSIIQYEINEIKLR